MLLSVPLIWDIKDDLKRFKDALWNSLPENIRKLRSLPLFKKALNDYYNNLYTGRKAHP